MQATSTTEYLNASNLTIIKCSSQILAQQVIPVVLNATAYLWGIYLFRLTDPEYLSTLMETVGALSLESSILLMHVTISNEWLGVSKLF